MITPDTALRLALDQAVTGDGCQLLAPTLLRSHVLSLPYQALRRGELSKKNAARQLDYVRALGIRLLGDRVLQGAASKVADQFGWPDAHDVGLTQLQADALITLDRQLSLAAPHLVKVAPIEALY